MQLCPLTPCVSCGCYTLSPEHLSGRGAEANHSCQRSCRCRLCTRQRLMEFQAQMSSGFWTNVRSAFVTCLVGHPHHSSTIGGKRECWEYCVCIIYSPWRNNKLFFLLKPIVINLETEWELVSINKTGSRLFDFWIEDNSEKNIY